ncbi:MAG TPA: response regulator [Candidatus Angelobacter sp.]
MTRKSAEIVIWISGHRLRACALLFLLMLSPLMIFAWSIRQQTTWAASSSLIVLSVAYSVLALAVVAFLAWLYAQADMGSRFMQLSVDLFCVIGFDGYFRRLNSSWRHLLSFTDAELKSRPYLEFVHPDDRATTMTETKRLQEQETAVVFDNRFVCANGSYKWLVWRAVSVPQKQLVYAVGREITETVQASQLVERKDKDMELIKYEPPPQGLVANGNSPAGTSHELSSSHTPAEAVVLLVDDDAIELKMLDSMLGKAGYQTRMASNGKAALSILSAVPVDAIVTDLVMPEMDGFQLIRYIREDPALGHVPLLVLTSTHLSRDEIKLLTRQTQGLFQKGRFWGPDLIAAVEAAIRIHKAAGMGESA